MANGGRREEPTQRNHTMAKNQILKAHTRKRSGSGALKQLRREGLIPAIVYGKGLENINLRLNRKAVNEVLSASASEQILVTLEIEDIKENRLALIQDVQHDALSGTILHMDFHAVREDEIIHAHVPIELVGDAAGVRAGGFLEFLLHSLDITCLPKDLPEIIPVDISGVNIGDAIQVRNIALPEGVKATTDGDVNIVHVVEMRVSEEPAAAPAAPAPAAAAKGAAPAADAKAPAKK